MLGTAAPGQTMNFFDVVTDASRNILFTCGMLVSSVFASFIAGFSFRNSGKLILASFTLGIVLLFFIGKGLLKAMMGMPMHWFMVRKNGNTVRSALSGSDLSTSI